MTMTIKEKSIMYKFFLGKKSGFSMKQKLGNESTGLLFDLISLPALGSKVPMLLIKIPVWIKWAKRHYLDVCYGG